MSCFGCTGKGTMYLPNYKYAEYEGNELVVREVVPGTHEYHHLEVVRIRCNYCTQCGREMEEIVE